MSVKILLFIDTNILADYAGGSIVCKNFKYLAISKTLNQNLIDKFKLANVEIQIAIPKIVFEEVIHHQIDKYEIEKNKLIDKYNQFKNIDEFELKFPIQSFNYQSYLEDKKNAFVSKYEIVEIDYPSNDIQQKLIQKVLKREKPFYKKNGNDKDTGFKDAICWESIINLVSEHNYFDKYYFLTNDNDFSDSKLQKEFKSKTKKELILVDEIARFKADIEEINNVIEDVNKGFEFYIGKQFNEGGLTIEGNEENVNQVYEFHIRDYEKTGEYTFKFIVDMKVEVETGYGDYTIIDPLYGYYAFEDKIFRVMFVYNTTKKSFSPIWFVEEL